MSLVNVVFDDSELLNSPLSNVNECLDLCPGSPIQSVDCRAEFLFELAIIAVHKEQDIDYFAYPRNNHFWQLTALMFKLVSVVLSQEANECKSAFEDSERTISHKEVQGIEQFSLNAHVFFQVLDDDSAVLDN